MINVLMAFVNLLQISFYTLSVSSVDNEQISMSNFQGKKVLLVNIATGSILTNQLLELEQLKNIYEEKLVIVAFPSNSFSNERKTNSEIKDFCHLRYQTSFFISEKTAVTGAGMNSIYSWLESQSENGSIQGEVIGDFQKFLIDENGRVVGVFSPNVSPLDYKIRDAIDADYN